LNFTISPVSILNRRKRQKRNTTQFKVKLKLVDDPRFFGLRGQIYVTDSDFQCKIFSPKRELVLEKDGDLVLAGIKKVSLLGSIKW